MRALLSIQEWLLEKGARKLGQLIVVAKSAKQKKKTSGGI